MICSNNHKIHIQASLAVSCYHNGGGTGAEIYIAQIIGGSSSAIWVSLVIGRSNNSHLIMSMAVIDYIDDPQTTSTITYKLYGRELHGNTSVSFNTYLGGSNYGNGQSYVGIISCTELAT